MVVADDHPYYRRGLVRSLRARGIEVVAEAPNGEAAIRAVEETAPDVVVMDLKMPGMSGFEATRQLTARSPASRVLVLSVSNDEEDVSDAVLAGACGYVLKESSVDEVVAGIRAAASGESHISQAITTPLLRRLRESGGARRDAASVRLSDREREVLDLLARGKEDEESRRHAGDDRGRGPPLCVEHPHEARARRRARVRRSPSLDLMRRLVTADDDVVVERGDAVVPAACLDRARGSLVVGRLIRADDGLVVERGDAAVSSARLDDAGRAVGSVRG